MNNNKTAKCPKCGKTNELVNFNNFRYPFNLIPKEIQELIKRQSEKGLDVEIMTCTKCGAFAVFPL